MYIPDRDLSIANWTELFDDVAIDIILNLIREAGYKNILLYNSCCNVNIVL